MQNTQVNSKKISGTSRLGQAAIISSSHLLNDVYTGILSPLLPILINTYSLSKFEAGLLAALISWPSVIQPFFGRLADTTNIQKYIFLFPLMTGTFMSLIGIAPNIGMLSLFLLLAGISSACFHAIAPPIAGKVAGKSSGKGLSLWMIGGELGWLVSPIIIIAFVEQFSLKKTPYLIIFAALAAVYLFFRLKKVDEINNHVVVKQSSMKSSLKAILPMLVPIALIGTSRALMKSSTTVYIPTYLTEEGANLWLAGAVYTLIMGAGILGTIVGGIYKDKIGGKPILQVSLLGSALFFLAFLYTNNILQIISIFLNGFFSGMYLPTALSMVQEYSPENRSFANGTYLALLFSISALANLVLGTLYDQFSGKTAFTIAGLMTLLGFFFAFFIPKTDPSQTP